MVPTKMKDTIYVLNIHKTWNLEFSMPLFLWGLKLLLILENAGKYVYFLLKTGKLQKQHTTYNTYAINFWWIKALDTTIYKKYIS